MNFYIERLDNELKNILKFWCKYVFNGEEISSEVYHHGTINNTATKGSLFLSKALFGISAASKYFGDDQYRQYADKVYLELIKKFKNPKGGFYWSVNHNDKIIHDEANTSYAQAFALLGLCEYYELTADASVNNMINEHVSFIENVTWDKNEAGFLDGFTSDWRPISSQTKSLATNLHMLEAYLKMREVYKTQSLDEKIEKLVETIFTYFLNSNFDIIQKCDKQWNDLPYENWIGQNMELGWLLCKAARQIHKESLSSKCKKAAIEICDRSIELAFDTKYGGMFNRFDRKELVITDKEWWTQAVSVIGFLNAYTITTDKKYLSYAIRILEYIDNIFSDPVNGEWYDSVSREGTPYLEKPKIHFWKSLYHNVNYCLEVSSYFQKLFVKTNETV